jgi:hypothetical protein
MRKKAKITEEDLIEIGFEKQQETAESSGSTTDWHYYTLNIGDMCLISNDNEEAKEKERALLIHTRKDELGEFGKDLSDEDIMNEDKYKIAKQSQLIAKLSEGKEIDEKDKELIPELSKGSADKDIDTEAETRKRISNLAWNSNDKDSEEEE